MDSEKEPERPLLLATAQMPITGDAVKNGRTIRSLMQEAGNKGARLIQFPEGALSGYAKNPIQSWEEVSWSEISTELDSIKELSKKLRLWVVVGSAHLLTPPNWPHNSLYIISDEGKIVTRYDKRICSHTEATRFFTQGAEPITFDVDGIKFGCLICVEINFPTLLIEYEKLGIDCLLLSSYPVDRIFYTKTRAYAAIHNFWIGLSVPTECRHLMKSGFIGPDGQAIAEVEAAQGVVYANLDMAAPQYVIALKRARPWRASAIDEFDKRGLVSDKRSTDRTTN